MDQDSIKSEAVIAYVEVPKIALLRTLVALMTVLWLVEWSLQGRVPNSAWFKSLGSRLQPSSLLSGSVNWLRQRPSRWLVLAVWFFLATTLLSTALSASFNVSLWGEVPGQDGFQAYTVLSYILLFGVVATHLKTQPQLWRLLAILIAVGVLISGYAVLQHYGRDFLGVAESLGGGPDRAPAFMGNAVFSAAAMLIPIGISLVTATITLREPVGRIGSKSWGVASPWALTLATGALWVLALAIQFLGLTFTLSRGPWAGTLLTAVGFISLAGVFVGWRIFGRGTLVIGLAAILTLACLNWHLVNALLNHSALFSLFLVLVALLGVGAIYLGWVRQGWAKLESGKSLPMAGLALGVVAAVAFGVFLASPEVRQIAFAPDEGGSPTNNIMGRFTSIGDQIATGNISNRGEIWRTSWRLIQHRPWFEFDELSLPWARQLVGYGPDLFRYTFLLEGIPTVPHSFLPMEADHAHNFFIHQWVEQGILGMLSSLGLFVAVFAAGGYQLWRNRRVYSVTHKLVLAGLLALFLGRFLEQMTGVARVSDLTIFWITLAVFAALPTVMITPAPAEVATPEPQETRRRSRTRRAEPQAYNWQLLGWLIVVAWISGGIFAVTWVKTINYARAAMAAGKSSEQLSRGDFQSSLDSLGRAVALAPDVATYHNVRAHVFNEYFVFREDPRFARHQQCAFRVDGVSYESCLAQKAYQNNLRGTKQRPFSWRSRLALADSSLTLRFDDEAIKTYQETVALVPSSWPLLNRLTEAYIEIEQFDEALITIQESLFITQSHSSSGYAKDLATLVHQKKEQSKQSSVP